MPKYDYLCDNCENRTELTRRIAERDALVICGVCEEPMHRVAVTRNAGFLLKGGGWAKDGYGSTKPS